MTIPKDNNQLENARRLRREMPPHERKLRFLFLRKYPVKIYKQRIIGKFIVDFYCACAKPVIEIDGSQHYEPRGMEYDAERSAFLSALGLEVLRFSNRDIDRDFRSVCEHMNIKTEHIGIDTLRKLFYSSRQSSAPCFYFSSAIILSILR